MSEPRARVVEVDGKLVLIDPDAVAVAMAVGKHNCRTTLVMNRDRVLHFSNRILEKGLAAKDVLMVIINVDDRYAELADALMPGHNWQEYRDRGETPFARGLAGREGIQSFLDDVDAESAKKLRELNGVAVVVCDHGTTEVFDMLDIS